MGRRYLGLSHACEVPNGERGGGGLLWISVCVGARRLACDLKTGGKEGGRKGERPFLDPASGRWRI